MFLTREQLRVARDDTGAAMAAVVGLMAVGIVLTAVISTSVVSSVSFTTLTRAGVQSHAAADAGVAAARAGLIAGQCVANNGVFESAPGAQPAYRATVFVETGTTWAATCPITTSARIRILSTGFATHAGLSGNSAGDETTVEAVLSAVEASGGLVPSGPAIYAYQSTGFTEGANVRPLSGTVADMMIRTGSVTCNGGASGQANLVLANGNLRVDNGCMIGGNAWVTNGTAIVTGGGAVAGNLVASGSVTLTRPVGGSVWSGGPFTANNFSGDIVGGSVTAPSISMSSTMIGGNAWVQGETYMGWSGTRIKGNLTSRTFRLAGNGAGSVGGTITLTTPQAPGPSPYLAPPAPTVPEWIDYAYDAADWPGFTVQTLSGACSWATITAAMAQIGTAPGIIDARGCTNGRFYMGGDNQLELRNDLVVIARQIHLTNGMVQAASPARLWLIVPDTTANALPTCPTNGSFEFSGGIAFAEPIRTLIYSPCTFALASSTHLRGQIYAGAVSFGGGAQLSYEAVGLPNADLGTGDQSESPGGSATEADRALLWKRTVSD